MLEKVRSVPIRFINQAGAVDCRSDEDELLNIFVVDQAVEQVALGEDILAPALNRRVKAIYVQSVEQCATAREKSGVLFVVPLTHVERAKSLWLQQPEARIIFVSDNLAESYIRTLIMAVPGDTAYGIVLKSSSAEQLAYAVRSVTQHNVVYVDAKLQTVFTRILLTNGWLSASELDTLNDLALGLTDKAIAARRSMTQRGVQSRVSSLYKKLLNTDDPITRKTPRSMELINPRVRLVFEACRRGWIAADSMGALNQTLDSWIETVSKP